MKPRARILITTTPRSVAILSKIVASRHTVVTRGSSHANPHLPEAFLEAIDEAHDTKEIIAENNQGGAMVRAVFHAADPSLRVKPAHAALNKSDRATPIAMRFEKGDVRLNGTFPELEAQLCGLIMGGGYEGPGTSPDRADAMVWALTELMLGKERAEPRVRWV